MKSQWKITSSALILSACLFPPGVSAYTTVETPNRPTTITPSSVPEPTKPPTKKKENEANETSTTKAQDTKTNEKKK